MGVDVYNFWHDPTGDPNGGTCSTFVSTSGQDIGCAANNVISKIGKPLARGVHFPLEFPTVSSDPEEGVRQTEQRYEGCARCHLSSARNRICYTRGNLHSPVVAIGEGPGKDEDLRGAPFVGISGRLQDELFRDCGIDPNEHLTWMNLVGCRPTNARWGDNRPPTQVEMAACSERTLMLLRAIRPRVIVCLGKEALRMFWPFQSEPSSWTWHNMVPPDSPGDWVLVGAARHPSYLARVMNQPASYIEYAAAKRFYGQLRDMLPNLSKTEAYRFGFQFLTDFPEEGDIGCL